MNRLYSLAGILEINAIQLLYMLERSRQLDIDSQLHLSDNIEIADNIFTSYLESK